MLLAVLSREVRMGVVRHPLSGRVEFACADDDLAEAVAGLLDERQPVGAAYVYEMFAEVPAEDRVRGEWVMPSEVLDRLRTLGTNPWRSFDLPGPTVVAILGRPVRIDETAEGLTFEVPG